MREIAPRPPGGLPLPHRELNARPAVRAVRRHGRRSAALAALAALVLAVAVPALRPGAAAPPERRGRGARAAQRRARVRCAGPG